MNETEVLKHLNKAIDELYTVDSNTTMEHGSQISDIITLLEDYRYKTYGLSIDWNKVEIND